VVGSREELRGIRDEILEDPGDQSDVQMGTGARPITDRVRPGDSQNVQLQEDGQQRFVGQLLWNVFDFMTFGAFGKKKAPK